MHALPRTIIRNWDVDKGPARSIGILVKIGFKNLLAGILELQAIGREGGNRRWIGSYGIKRHSGADGYQITDKIVGQGELCLIER